MKTVTRMKVAGLFAALWLAAGGCSSVSDTGDEPADAADFIGLWVSTSGDAETVCSDGTVNDDYSFSEYYLRFVAGTSNPLMLTGSDEGGVIPAAEFACWYGYDLVGRQALLASSQQNCDEVFGVYSVNTFTLLPDGETLEEVAAISPAAPVTPGTAAICTFSYTYRFKRAPL
jgi:hypothetical protein